MMQYVLLSGTSPVDIKTVPLIVLSFSLPAITEAEFFSARIVENLAIFLGVPQDKIKIVSIVRETIARFGSFYFRKIYLYITYIIYYLKIIDFQISLYFLL